MKGYICAVLVSFLFSHLVWGKGVENPGGVVPLWMLLLSEEDNHALPRNFRTTWDAIPASFDSKGLVDLRMVGSGQFTASQFSSIVQHMGKFGVSPDQIVVVDLREEPHAFINGHGVRWYSDGAWWTYGDPLARVIARENEFLDRLFLGQAITVKRIMRKDEMGYPEILKDYSYVVDSLETEDQIVTRAGAHYVRLPVTDHAWPSDKAVDQFLGLVKNLPPQACVYFHCHAGKGRTSTFMMMYDMLRNPKLAREVIMDRQVQLGARDLRCLSGPLKARKHPNEISRLHFMNLFYDYLNAIDGYGKTSWTQWATRQYEKRGALHGKNRLFSDSEMVAQAGKEPE